MFMVFWVMTLSSGQFPGWINSISKIKVSQLSNEIVPPPMTISKNMKKKTMEKSEAAEWYLLYFKFTFSTNHFKFVWSLFCSFLPFLDMNGVLHGKLLLLLNVCSLPAFSMWCICRSVVWLSEGKIVPNSIYMWLVQCSWPVETVEY